MDTIFKIFIYVLPDKRFAMLVVSAWEAVLPTFGAGVSSTSRVRLRSMQDFKLIHGSIYKCRQLEHHQNI